MTKKLLTFLVHHIRLFYEINLIVPRLVGVGDLDVLRAKPPQNYQLFGLFTPHHRLRRSLSLAGTATFLSLCDISPIRGISSRGSLLLAFLFSLDNSINYNLQQKGHLAN